MVILSCRDVQDLILYWGSFLNNKKKFDLAYIVSQLINFN
jgi:hypothetical protein